MVKPPQPVRRIDGTVRKIVRDKGFGFIGTATGIEYFFHHSACPDFDRLTEGTSVTFIEGASGKKGPRAEQVART
jgi:cold shock protein